MGRWDVSVLGEISQWLSGGVVTFLPASPISSSLELLLQSVIGDLSGMSSHLLSSLEGKSVQGSCAFTSESLPSHALS